MEKENKYIHNALKQVHLKTAFTGIHGFSISGLATYLQFPELDFVVDMGECPLSAIPLDHVFLTHAHGDHARCLMRHHSLRKMMGVERPSVYYLPESIIEKAKEWIHAEAMFENVSDYKFKLPELKALKPHKKIPLEYRKDLVIEPFEVKHSVPSMGGTLYLHKRKLKAEFLGKSPAEIIQLKKDNVEITNEIFEPLISFTGDCLGDTLMRHPHVFNSRILITECTFVADEDVEMASKKGHTHLNQIADTLIQMRESIHCEKIILIHFSMKHSEKFIRETVERKIPKEFLDKIELFI